MDFPGYSFQSFQIDKWGNLFFLKSDTLFISKDQGSSWIKKDFQNTIHNFLSAPGNILFCFAGDKFFRSLDGGSSWENIESNVNIPYIRHIVVHDSGELFITTDQALYKSSELDLTNT